MSTQDLRTVTLPQARIAYRESGSGDPLLFVHGWPVSSLTWRKVIPALEPSYRCIAADLMGAGETEPASMAISRCPPRPACSPPSWTPSTCRR